MGHQVMKQISPQCQMSPLPVELQTMNTRADVDQIQYSTSFFHGPMEKELQGSLIEYNYVNAAFKKDYVRPG